VPAWAGAGAGVFGTTGTRRRKGATGARRSNLLGSGTGCATGSTPATAATATEAAASPEGQGAGARSVAITMGWPVWAARW
jgi:hypothetical protein